MSFLQNAGGSQVACGRHFGDGVEHQSTPPSAARAWPSRQRRRLAASHGSARNIPDNRATHPGEGTLKLDLEKLDELIKLYENRSIDDFLTIWQKISPGEVTKDTSRVDAALVEDYVARLRAPRDIEGVLVDLRNDKRVRARECIEIAARLSPTSRRPRSRNRALHAIRSCPRAWCN